MTEGKPGATLASSFLRALEKEKAADLELTEKALLNFSPKVLTARGLALINLNLTAIRTGYGGNTLATFELDTGYSSEDQELSPGEIRVGDNVRIDHMSVVRTSKPSSSRKDSRSKDGSSGDNAIEGVVQRLTSKSIVVAIDERYDSRVFDLNSQDRLWLCKTTNETTYRRMESTMTALAELESPTYLQSILLGKEKGENINITPAQIEEFYGPTLNEPQKEAVKFALGSSPLTMIHGPPGTGKTSVLVEIIRHLIAKNERVLVCGPSNISVDTIIERLDPLMKDKSQLLRLGHPARLLNSVLDHSMDFVTKTCEGADIVKDVKSDIDSAVRKIPKTRNGRERREIFDDLKFLRKEYRSREKKLSRELIEHSQVVVATLHGSGSRDLIDCINTYGKGRSLFSTIIIDEVSQSLESQCWIPILTVREAQRVILAGDHLQLPPTVKIESSTQAKSILQTTLFDRLVKTYGDTLKKMLTIQYRMHEDIMKFPSLELYDNKLLAHESVESHLLSDLPGVEATDETTAPYIWVDTEGGNYSEKDVTEANNARGLSGLLETTSGKCNPGEAEIVKAHLTALVETGKVDAAKIGVISPYNAQVSLLKKMVHSMGDQMAQIEISTVDGFQGREKEAILISLVRSNEDGNVGFLSEARRLNVAMTRPKRHLCVVGDMETLKKGSKFLAHWIDWAEENAEIRYPDMYEV